MDGAEQAIFEIAQRRSSNALRHISDVASSVYESLTLLATSPEKSRGVKTGHSSLDNVLVHLGEGDFVIGTADKENVGGGITFADEYDPLPF